jgi:hypothetical protein
LGTVVSRLCYWPLGGGEDGVVGGGLLGVGDWVLGVGVGDAVACGTM